MNRYAISTLLFCAASAFAAPQAAKQPWQWSDEERLASRFDAQSRAERTAAYRQSHPGAEGDGQRPPASGLTYVIDGRRNPELFMRHELLDHLLRGLGSNASDRETYQRALQSDLAALGMDASTFWAELEKAGHSYLLLKRKLEARGHGRSRADQNGLCAARATMLAAAEKRFGAERFAKLLYTVVAPSIVHSESTTYPDPAGQLRREAEGCP